MTDLEDQAMDLFADLVGLSREQRGERLHAACGSVPELRARVEELLAHHQEAEREAFLEPPPLPPDHPSEALPRHFGNYELLELVARGGQGTVYRARQVHINKEVALKLVNPKDRRHSLRELRIAADLTHEHFVRVYHVGEHEGQLYFTMKLAEKGSLDKHIDEYRLQDAPATTAAEQEAVEERKQKIARFMAKIARAVHYIHEQGFIHRDLKPGNILLDARGEPLVADLGLARRIKDDRAEALPLDRAEPAEEGTRGAAGTPGYMAPEQAQGRTDLGRPVDVYGLGALLYQLLTGEPPFVGTPTERSAQTADPERLVPPPSAYNPNVGTGSELSLICLECLAKEPDRRYRSAADLADDLERFARGEPISIRRVGWLERWTRHLVGAINRKLSIPGIARWRVIDLWDAGLNLAVNGVLFALIRADQPPALLWGAQLTYIVVWWWMFLTYLFRQDPLDPTERHLALLWGGVFLGGVTLFSIYCPPFGPGRAAGLLAFYPPWAVVNGLAFLIVGRLYWGRYYLVGLAHFLVAFLMAWWLDLAPLVYGVFAAVCVVWGACGHTRKARPEGP
jgi:eukaryotic-like serine/threonine-protein kinase